MKEADEQLFLFIKKCMRHHNVPDLHSFVIDIAGGKAFVDCGSDFVLIQEVFDDGSYNRFAGTCPGAAKRLLELGADYSTIDM